MLLHRRDQGLDDKDIAFPAIGLELHTEAVVCVTLYLRWQQRNLEAGTYFCRQKRMRSTTENGDFAQRPQTLRKAAPRGDRVGERVVGANAVAEAAALVPSSGASLCRFAFTVARPSPVVRRCCRSAGHNR